MASELEQSVDYQSFQPQQQSAEDKKLLVKFFLKPKEDKQASRAEGRPIFRDVEYVDIRIPGNRTGGACRPATEMDRRRFPEHYAAFKNRATAPSEGTPLTEWPQIPRRLVEELAFFNVKTVEQLVNMADNHAQQFMGINEWRKRARVWLENAEDEKATARLMTELEERDKKIAMLEQKLDQLIAAKAPDMHSGLDEAEAETAPEPRRRRGRPRKVEADAAVSDDQ